MLDSGATKLVSGTTDVDSGISVERSVGAVALGVGSEIGVEVVSGCAEVTEVGKALVVDSTEVDSGATEVGWTLVECSTVEDGPG